ncbi:hypothetical protein GGG87_07355 [Streptococcus sp. zg-86]|uniref:DUF5648 domain-containing protein n=1 Tax=Streptococcus zhangguiae TaxID=2664091 RepID=A0A6I4RJ24_9STRE|nr:MULTISPECIES: hypothetical protein [unclassified Streptococcus]MTB64810.1 hypothetical protein [Streptococcus sp. zg-86]MTB91120.1 hypothetical protein [Streptococcus sp. zg-36]MWV56797.1 hypothetical protein [Streptococcus sp. zg-70]QTH48394.1 hypothetical protein J5M87_03470 [Streptococcus sp. zg-86]
MKKKKYLLFALLCAVGLSFYSVKAEAETTVYRLYNKDNGEHLYTTDKNEKDVLFSSHGWGYEGEAWYAPDSGEGVPVYRLYNPSLQNHLYTTDQNEVTVLTTKHGWKMDNNGQPVFYSGGSASIYRVYNKNLRGLHHLTTDTNEYKVLPSHGWSQEGIKLNALRVGIPIKTQYHEAMQANNTKPTKDVAVVNKDEETKEKPLPTVLPTGHQTIENTPSKLTIEADVTLSGSGTGYHAKLVMVTPTSGISFGLQYDLGAVAPYSGQTAFLIENIGSNNPGEQHYHRANYFANLNTTYHLMLTLQEDGSYVGYVNGAEVIRGRNPVLANRQDIYLRVEGAARRSGDSVNARFSNIKLKAGSQYIPTKTWTGTPQFNRDNGIMTKMDNQLVPNTAAAARLMPGTIEFSGSLTGLPLGTDWDTQGYYDKASGLVQFY